MKNVSKTAGQKPSKKIVKVVEKVEAKSVAIVKQEEAMSFVRQQQNDVNMMISQAIKENVPAETMERFLAMRRELKAEFAKEQFDEAMAKFQTECPVIKKTKGVSDNEKNQAYSYAPIDLIISTVKDIIGKNGFSYITKIEVNDKGVKATCIVKHIAGHSEISEMQVPLGTKTKMMSDTQVVAAASTFAKRYAFLNAFGIMTGEDSSGRDLKDAPSDQIEIAIEALEKCMTLKKLTATFLSLSKELQANKEILIKANQIKSNITNENSQNRSAK
jgi:hypothetical protein